jgi:filamentous hemagglutinin family protein
MRGFNNTRLLLAAALCCYAGFTQAQIQSTSSTNGVSIDVASTNVTNITAPDNAIIEYSQFDVGSGQTVNFLQPSVASRVLNRINSHTPSQINGNINANGVMYFVNPAGVTFGPNSVVDAAGIYAAAGAICDADFLNGFDVFKDVSGDVNLQGTVNADIIAAFVGKNVVNTGNISVPCGTVVLASGKKVLIGSPMGGLMVQVGALTGGFDGSVSNQGNIKARQTTLISRDIYSVVIDPDHGEMYDASNTPGIDVSKLDTNGDNVINLEDIQTAMDNNTGPLEPGTGGKTQAQGDIDGDGDVDNDDIGMLFVACGAMIPTPPNPPTPPTDPPPGPFNLVDLDYIERLPPLTEFVNLTEADLGILRDQLGITLRQPSPIERSDKVASRAVYDDFAARNAGPAGTESSLVIANTRLDADVVREALAVYRERLAAEGISPADRSVQLQSDTNNAYDNYVSTRSSEGFDAQAFSRFVQESNPALFDNLVALFELKRLTLNMGLNEREKQNSERVIIERSRPAKLNYEQMKATLDASGELAQQPDEIEPPIERDEDAETAES